MLSRIDDPQMGEIQTLKGLVHRFGYFRGFAEFAFNSVPAAVIDEKKINLSTAMGGPEKCLGRLNDLQNLFDSKAFPRCPHPGIAVQCLKIGKVKQSVKEARIPQVDLRCFDLALTEVFVPRFERHQIAFREASQRSIVIPAPEAAALESLIDRFQNETFGARAGGPVNGDAGTDSALEGELARRGVDAYHQAFARYLFCAICGFEDGSLVLLSEKIGAGEVIRRVRPVLQGLGVEIHLPA